MDETRVSNEQLRRRSISTSGKKSNNIGKSSASSLSALFDICRSGDLKALKSAQRVKKDIHHLQDKHGRKLIHYCSQAENILCLEHLVNQSPELLKLEDADGYTILHLAVINGNKVVTAYLCHRSQTLSFKDEFLNCRDNEGHTPFHWATVCKEYECLDLLFKAGASPSIPDIHGAHPIHYAAQISAGNELRDKEKSETELLGKLLSFPSVSPDVKDREGRTPLLWAASVGNTEALLVLANAGANVFAQDIYGLTALHCAASKGRTNCAETLISLCNADVDQIDVNGCSPLFYSVTMGHADCTQLLLQHGAEPNKQDFKGRTSAHCGCSRGQLETLKLLAQHGANLWIKNGKGDVPLHDAVKSGRKELVWWLLYQFPGAATITNNSGKSLLHIAAANNNVEMCKILIDCGVNINSVMKCKTTQRTPLDTALYKGHRNCAKFLLLHGALPANRVNSDKPPSRGFTIPHSLNSDESQSGVTEPLNSVSSFQIPRQVEESSQYHKKITSTKYRTFEERSTSTAYSTKTHEIVDNSHGRQSIITNVYVNARSGKVRVPAIRKVKRKQKKASEKRDEESSQVSTTPSSGLVQAMPTPKDHVLPVITTQFVDEDGAISTSNDVCEDNFDNDNQGAADEVKVDKKDGEKERNKAVDKVEMEREWVVVGEVIASDIIESSLRTISNGGTDLVKDVETEEPGGVKREIDENEANSDENSDVVKTEEKTVSHSTKIDESNVDINNNTESRPEDTATDLVVDGSSEAVNCSENDSHEVSDADKGKNESDIRDENILSITENGSLNEIIEAKVRKEDTGGEEKKAENIYTAEPLVNGNCQESSKSKADDLPSNEKAIQDSQEEKEVLEATSRSEHSDDEHQETQQDKNESPNSGNERLSDEIKEGQRAKIVRSESESLDSGDEGMNQDGISHKPDATSTSSTSAKAKQTDENLDQKEESSETSNNVSDTDSSGKSQGQDESSSETVITKPTKKVLKTKRASTFHGVPSTSKESFEKLLNSEVETSEDKKREPLKRRRHTTVIHTMDNTNLDDDLKLAEGRKRSSTFPRYEKSEADRTSSRCSHILHQKQPITKRAIDLSGVTAKVDTHNHGVGRRPAFDGKHKTISRCSCISPEVNPQIILQTMEKSLRKYQMERKLFEQLQELKRCQIRTSRVNEPLLVKRLLEKYKREIQYPGLEDFSGTYNYRAYETFLYSQLRSLSSSNHGKVLPLFNAVSNENISFSCLKQAVEDSYSSNPRVRKYGPYSRRGSQSAELIRDLENNRELLEQPHSAMENHSAKYKGKQLSFQDFDPPTMNSTTTKSAIKTSNYKTNSISKVKITKLDKKPPLQKGTKEATKLVDKAKSSKVAKSPQGSNSSRSGVSLQNAKRDGSRIETRRIRSVTDNEAQFPFKTTAKYDQMLTMRRQYKRECLKPSEKVRIVEASKNRAPLKRRKTKIPIKEEITVKEDEIRERWQRIKYTEKRKYDRTRSNSALDLHLIYEVNKGKQLLYNPLFLNKEDLVKGKRTQVLQRSLSDSVLIRFGCVE